MSEPRLLLHDAAHGGRVRVVRDDGGAGDSRTTVTTTLAPGMLSMRHAKQCTRSVLEPPRPPRGMKRARGDDSSLQQAVKRARLG